jgi:menaquinone-dependent protoporphyrinogen oxidase
MAEGTMGVLLVYSTRHGTTRKVGEYLAAKWPGIEVTFFDLAKGGFPDLRKYDCVVIGASVHAGFIQAEVRQFVESKKELLMRRTLGLYMCFMDKVRAAENFDRAFPEMLRVHASASALAGGELIFENMSWLDKLIVGRFTHFRENVSHLDYAQLDAFADAMLAAMEHNRAQCA